MTDHPKLEEYDISPGEEYIEHIEERISKYQDETGRVLESLQEINKTRDTGPEYSNVYQSAGSFFHQANGFWDRTENPEESYLQARKEDLPLPDAANISSIEIDLESDASNCELGLYAEFKEGEVETYWDVEIGETSTHQNRKEVLQEVDSILETAQNIGSNQGETEWSVGKSLVEEAT